MPQKKNILKADSNEDTVWSLNAFVSNMKFLLANVYNIQDTIHLVIALQYGQIL